MPERFTKDPQAVLDYVFNWSGWLEQAETIATHTITVPTGLTVDSHTEAAGIITVWLSGGTPLQDYAVACKVTTSLGRTDERTATVMVRER
ncbi:MAG TPA: hypothetical protein PKD55_09635 [Bellilinea sp.]|nr:hypothetical protein [Bellilinea sp.]